jgi:hypothetical protein
MPPAVRWNAELLLSSGGLKGTGKEFRTTEAIRRQRLQSRQRVALVSWVVGSSPGDVSSVK